MIIYISGPMSGLPNANRSRFFMAEHDLKAQGHIVLNPANHPDGLSQDQYMHMCYAMIDCSDAIYLLPGWENSKGANLEHEYAKCWAKEIIISGGKNTCTSDT